MSIPVASQNILRTPLSTHRLLRKVAVITSGGGEIGVETAGRFLREGAKVVLVDIDASTLDAAHYVKSTVRAFGQVDIAFLNAGISYVATSLLETSEEDFESVMRVNVKSAFLGIKHAAIVMKQLGNGGSIILTSSIAELTGTPGLILTSGSKFGLRGLSLTAASELGQYVIRVNTIHPGGENTPMFRNARSPENSQDLKAAIPLGRFARVDDVGSVVAFLASEGSKFMTGNFSKIDGGSLSI